MTCARRTALLVTLVLALAPVPSAIGQQPAQAPPPQGAPPTPAAPQGRSDARTATQGFSIVLVLADLQGAAGQDDVPPAARRALADMKDFLPYKSYKLLDAAWILGQGTTGTITRLRGVEGHEYELHMTATPLMVRPEAVSRSAPTGAVNVRFTLSEASSEEAALKKEAEHALQAELARRADETATRAAEQQHRVALLEQQLRAAQREKNQARIRELQQELTRARTRTARGQQETPRPSSRRFGGMVIHTTFTMDVGETVVVGTSRLRDNSRALIALLTAVPMRGSRTPVETGR